MNVSEKIDEFLREHYEKNILKAASKGQTFVFIDFNDLDRFDIVVAENLLEYPDEIIEQLNEAAQKIADGKMIVRIKNLPERRNIRIRNLRAVHLNKMWIIDSTIKSATEVKPQIYEVDYECPSCGTIIKVKQKGNLLQKPEVCECGRRGDFKQVEKRMFDMRWLNAIEPFEITTGEQPGEISVFLKEDLTTPKMQKMTDPGARLRIIGILKELPKRIKGKLSTRTDVYLEANYVEPAETEYEEIEITEEDKKEIIKLAKDPNVYEKLKASLAPAIYGFEEIKESILLQLFGGINHRLPDGTRIRGNIHILITGDPGVGKSQILKLVSTVVPRGRYVSGKGVSVDYDDPIIFMENNIIKTDLIGRVIDKYYKENEHGVFVPVENIRVPSFDPQTYKIRWRPASSVYRHTNNEPLQKISLKTGRELRVTRGHSVYVLDKGTVTTKIASKIKRGDFIVLPSSIPSSQNPIKEIDMKKEISKLRKEDKRNISTVSKNGNEYLKCTFSKHIIPTKISVDKRLAWLLGYYIADGSLTIDPSLSRKVKFDVSGKDKKVLKKLKLISKQIFNVEPRIYKRKDSNCFNVYIYDKIIYLLFKNILKVGTRTETKGVPEIIFNASPKLQLEFIKGWFDGDYGVTISKTLMSDIMYLYFMNNTIASFTRKRIRRTMEFPDGHKSKINREVYQLKAPVPFKKFKNKHSYLPLSQFMLDFTNILQKTKYTRASPSSEKIIFSKFRKMFFDRLQLIKKNQSSGELMKTFGMKNIKSCRDYLKKLFKMKLIKTEKVDGKNFYSLSEYGNKLVERYKEFIKIFESDFGFVQVIKNEKVKPTGKFVYDFSVKGCENFVAGFGGVVCHNTGAGLTATVRKDEMLGSWVLEAGALILCNRGLISIDEFDKMNRDDQIAMHEAMSMETVSIAKANIMATLPAQTAVLAGANPKMGRFDPMLSVAEQIQIPETLLSRFDLKFALKDKPDKTHDEMLAEHIITSRTKPHMIEPLIDVRLIRKFIAYSKQIDKIELSPEAAKELKNFYVDMRNRYSGEEVPTISITLRQYEALIRMAEASAKIRLDDVVRMEDADRAIKLMKYSLSQLGVDAETGRIDIDKIESGITASKRRRFGLVSEIIADLQKSSKEIAIEDIKAEAESRGIEGVDEIVEKLKRDGVIFEPRAGFIRKI